MERLRSKIAQVEVPLLLAWRTPPSFIARLYGPAAIAGLVEVMQGHREEDKIAALDALKLIGAPAIPALMGIYEGHLDSGSGGRLEELPARHLYKTLMEMEEAVDPLIGSLVDRDLDHRSCEILSAKGATIVPRLIQELKEGEGAIRRNVALILARIGDGMAIGPLVEAMDDEDPGIRGKAAEALGRMNAQSAKESIWKACGDADPKVRWSSMEALLRIDDHRALGRLVEALGDGDPGVRMDAACLLVKLEDSRGNDHLIKVLENGDMLEAEDAIDALEQAGLAGLIRSGEMPRIADAFKARIRETKAAGTQEEMECLEEWAGKRFARISHALRMRKRSIGMDGLMLDERMRKPPGDSGIFRIRRRCHG